MHTWFWILINKELTSQHALLKAQTPEAKQKRWHVKLQNSSLRNQEDAKLLNYGYKRVYRGPCNCKGGKSKIGCKVNSCPCRKERFMCVKECGCCQKGSSCHNPFGKHPHSDSTVEPQIDPEKQEWLVGYLNSLSDLELVRDKDTNQVKQSIANYKSVLALSQPQRLWPHQHNLSPGFTMLFTRNKCLRDKKWAQMLFLLDKLMTQMV